jgi:hypothetical protein
MIKQAITEGAMRMRAAGTTDEITTCECCGRENLKGTVIMMTVDADGNDIAQSFFGSTCAARAAGRPVAEIDREAAGADKAAREAAARARRQAAAARELEWAEWLAANSAAGSRLEQIEELGGISAALAAFNSAA